MLPISFPFPDDFPGLSSVVFFFFLDFRLGLM